MTCPQCHAELSDSATFCQSCGTAVRSATFSYLPAGTPAWPTVAPVVPRFIEGSSYYVPGQSLPPAEPLSEAPLAPKPRRSTSSILFIVALFLLAPLIGVGLTLGILWSNRELPTNTTQAAIHIPPSGQTPSPSNSLTPTSTVQSDQLPTPTSFQAANSPQVGIMLKYPSDWVADAPSTTTSGNVSVNFHPQQQLPVDLLVGRLSPSNSASVTGTSEINQANLQAFGSGQNLTNMQILTTTPLTSNVGGTSWDEQDATFLTSSQVSIHVVSISVKHNTNYYTIFYFAPTSVFDEAVQKYYSQMLSSFQFLS